MILRRGLLLAVSLILGMSALSAQSPAELKSFNEDELSKVLSENRNNVVLIDFWATWCAPCRKELPLLADLQKRLGARGFQLVTVSADEPGDKPAALEMLKEYAVPGPAYIKSVEDDDAFIESIDPKWSGALPALFLYDRSGKLAHNWIGETEMSEIEKAIAGLL